MKNYAYVFKFDEKPVPRKYLEDCLQYAWKYTPSKNNFMNYTVHVLGPKHRKIKTALYYKCLQNQMNSNKQKFDSLEEYDRNLTSRGIPPTFSNILSAPYALIYTQRVETQLNPYQQEAVGHGCVFEQTFPVGTQRYNQAMPKLEIGMFSTNFANRCFKYGLDVSYVACMPTTIEDWQEPIWDFITERPLLIQLVGYGKDYIKDRRPPDKDRKPSFERIVNIL